MSKNAKKPAEPKKLEPHKPSAEHVERVEALSQSALQAQARLGRGFLELLGVAQRAREASANVDDAIARAAISVNIDPDRGGWRWDPAANAFVPKE